MDRCRSLEIWQVTNEGQRPLICDVHGGELRGFPLFYDWSRGCFRFLLLPSLGSNYFFPSILLLSVGLFVILTICVVGQMLSSSVKYLSARLYNSSIVVSGFKDNEWKKGVDGPKLLLKF